MTSSLNPVFKFKREAYAVRVENVAESVSRREIVELFNSLIGDVRKCEEAFDDNRRILTLSFSTQDAAKKALCMSGYTVAGVPLTVKVPLPSEGHRIIKQGKQLDVRRNLYVLGLPFDLTKSEFAEIFSHYGSVAHAVILATVDNASRRRGFVVMSRHGEAKLAMDALNRKEINGHVIDVSWAVVQRSEGFLDGGDRTTMLANQSPSPSPAQFELGCTNTAVSLPHTPITVTPPAEAHPSRYSVQTASLLVKNLPAVLFSQPADLHPLFGPFGEVKRLDILPSASAGVLQNNISVVVEYATMTQAMEALQVLHGQAYSSDPVTAEFLQPIAPEGDAAVLMSPGDDMKAGLNPLATPFIIPAGFPPNTLLAPLASIYPEAKVHRTDLTAASNGLLAVNPQHLTPYATPSSLMYMPVIGTTRPNSAPSDWAGQPYHLVPGRRPILLDTLQLRFHSITSSTRNKPPRFFITTKIVSALYTRFRHGFIERYRA